MGGMLTGGIFSAMAQRRGHFVSIVQPCVFARRLDFHPEGQRRERFFADFGPRQGSQPLAGG